jgi:hypothetical protein
VICIISVVEKLARQQTLEMILLNTHYAKAMC